MERINTAKGFCAKRSQRIPELHRNSRFFLEIQTQKNMQSFKQHNNKWAEAIFTSTAFYSCRLFCTELFVTGQF